MTLTDEDIEANQLLGKVYYNSGRFSEAIEVFSRIVQRSPLNRKIVFNLSRSYAKLDKY